MKNNNHNCQFSQIKKLHQDRVRRLTSKLKCGSSPKQESRRLKVGSQNFSSKNFTAPKNGNFKAKAELKQAHQFLQTIIDYLPVALFVKDATPENFGMIRFCNKACENLFGLTGEQIVGATTYEYYPIAQSHFFNQKDREAIQQGKVLEIPEETFTSQNSGQRILKTLKVPIYDGNNHPQYLLCISEDITERKQVEAALQESEERFQAFMNHSPASTWITDIDGTLLYVNPNWLNLLKLPTQDVIGKNLFEIFPTEIAEQYYENNHLIAETNKVIEFIESAVQKNGDPGHFLVYKFPIQGIKKQTVIGGIAVNITEEVKAEQALRTSESRFRAAIDGSLDAFFVLESVRDKAGKIIDFVFVDLNINGAKMISSTREEVIGQRLCELLPVNRTDGFFEKYVRVVETRQPLEEEFPLSQPGVTASWLQHQVIPLGDGIAITSRDISDRKATEEALRLSEECYRLIAEHFPNGAILLFDQNLRFLLADGLGLAEVGLSKAQLEGKTIWEVFPSETVAVIEPLYRGALAGQSSVTEVNFAGRIYLVHALPIQNERGQAETGLVMTQDITKLKRAEKALQDQAEQEHIITVITHRIRQSLDLQEILETTGAEVREYLQCDRVIIYQFDRDFKGTVIAESVDQKWRSMLSLVIGDCYFQEIYVQLYQQGRVHAVSDIYTAGLSPCHLDLLARFQVRANLAVPIVEDRKLWGLLIAQHCEAPREWQSLEISLLKQLATQVAIAIQQSELYQQAQLEIAQRRQIETTLQQKIKREKLLAATAQRIRQSLDLDEIINTTVMEVRQLLQADRTVIFRFEPDWSGVISVESVTTPDLSILNTTIYDPCFEETYIKQYRQGRTRAIEDIYQANLSQCYLDLLTQFKVRANLVVPILQGEHLWGLLIAHQCTQARQWQPHETELLEQLATQVGIAIAQGQLYEQTRRQAQREQAFNQVIQAIRTSLDLETIFSTATEEVCKLLQAERTVICRYLPEEKLWRNVADFHLSSDLPSALGLEVPDEDNEIADRLKQRQIFQIDDARQCAETYNQNYARIFPGSWLMVPLHFGSVLWGSLGLIRNQKNTPWQAWEVELADAIANQLAIAIQQSELYQQLEQLATLDGLTQIANRRYFDQYLDQEWKRSQREQISLSLLLLDVDHFKLYNDTYGHQAGDECLQKVAKAIRESLKRSSDLVARYGGEEFVVLLPNTKTEGAIQVAQDIHHSIQQLAIEHSRSSVSQFVTVSIGISTTIPKPNSRFEALVSRADLALYEAKRQRNTYRLHRLAF